MRGYTWNLDAARATVEKAKLKRASPACCRHPGGLKVAARTLLVESRSAASNAEMYAGSEVPARRLHRRFCVRGSCSAGERERGRGMNFPP